MKISSGFGVVKFFTRGLRVHFMITLADGHFTKAYPTKLTIGLSKMVYTLMLKINFSMEKMNGVFISGTLLCCNVIENHLSLLTDHPQSPVCLFNGLFILCVQHFRIVLSSASYNRLLEITIIIIIFGR